MRTTEELTRALEENLSGVTLSPWKVRRMADAVTAGEPESRRRLMPAWLVALAVGLAASLWPLTAASERLMTL